MAAPASVLGSGPPSWRPALPKTPLVALALQQRFRGRPVVIAALILPWALPGVVEGIVWTGIWDANVGLFNSVLTSAHLIDHYHVAILVGIITVAVELVVLAIIRARFFRTGFLRSFATVTLGGVIIVAVSAALGSAA